MREEVAGGMAGGRGNERQQRYGEAGQVLQVQAKSASLQAERGKFGDRPVERSDRGRLNTVHWARKSKKGHAL